MYQPSCFIIMPFNKKKGKENIEFDFNAIYANLIKPAVEQAGLMPIRADQETTDGSIHKAMYERLLLCDYAICDLSTANANVYYELGMRHTVKPHTTICIMSNKTFLEFDLNLNRTYPYGINEAGELTNLDNDIQHLKEKLELAKTVKTTDSPVLQLVNGISFQNSLAHEKTDVFRDRVMYEEATKTKLNEIRNHKPKEERLKVLTDFVATLVPIENQETGVLIDVMLSYRAISEWNEMKLWIEKLPEYVFNTQMVQEQYGFALNRNNEKEKAIDVLEKLITKNGTNPETNGILGRVYKDMADLNKDTKLKYNSFLKKAIETYLSGFEADMRDAYPGVNAVTLLFLNNDERYKKYASAVEIAVQRKMKMKTPDYWDYATLLELAVISQHEEDAMTQVEKALATQPDDWMFTTTKGNLAKIKAVFIAQGVDIGWITDIEEGLC